MPHVLQGHRSDAQEHSHQAEHLGVGVVGATSDQSSRPRSYDGEGPVIA